MATCLILGSADCLHDDLARYAGPVDGCVACNDAGAEWPGRLDAWVTLHPSHWVHKGWLAARRRNGYPDALELRTNNTADVKNLFAANGIEAVQTEYCFPGQEHSGSSGMFAAKVALIDLGFERAVLCGIPMTPTPHFYGGPAWDVAGRYLQRWRDVPAEYKDRIRSMSGATRELLGAP